VVKPLYQPIPLINFKYPRVGLLVAPSGTVNETELWAKADVSKIRIIAVTNRGEDNAEQVRLLVFFVDASGNSFALARVKRSGPTSKAVRGEEETIR
jgi:hypothetical protein